MKKKVLSLLLAACLVVGMLPLVASAAEPGTVLPAKLHDTSEAIADSALYTSYKVTSQEVTPAEGTAYTEVTVTVENLKEHWNAADPEAPGYWAGMFVVAPADATQYQYAISNENSFGGLSEPSGALDGMVDPEATDKTVSGIGLYADAEKDFESWLEVQWLDAEGKLVGDAAVYHMVLDPASTLYYDVATVGEKSYGTLEEAVNAVNETNKVITLIHDVQLKDAVTINKDLTIEGNGYTIYGMEDSVNAYFNVTGGTVAFQNMTLTNFGGKVETTTSPTRAVIYAPEAGNVVKLTVSNVNFSNFNRAAIDIRDGGANFDISGCVIDCNNVTKKQLTKGILVQGEKQDDVKGTISNCTITGAVSDYEGWSSNGIEANAGANVTIRGTTIQSFTGGVSVGLNYGGTAEANVTLSGDNNIQATNYAVRLFQSGNTGVALDGQATGKITIDGGKYNGDVRISVATGDTLNEGNKIVINGGYFTSDPTEFLAKGMAALTSDVDGYSWTVGLAGENAAEVVPAAPSVETSVEVEEGSAAETLLNNVAAVLNPEEGAPSFVDSNTLSAAIATTANKNPFTEEYATTSLKAVDVTTEGKTVSVIYQPYMSIQITDVAVDGEENSDKSFTLEITPMYRVVATTAENPSTDPLVFPAKEGETPVEDVNAVVMDGDTLELGTTEVVVPLPTDFVSGTNPIYVLHDGKHYHKADVAEVTSAEPEETTYTATFTTEGFSPFVFSTSAAPVASIGDMFYDTLQAAVDAVEDGEVIDLLADVEDPVSVNKVVTFQIKPGVYKCTVNAGDGYDLTGPVDNEDGTFTYTVTEKEATSSGVGGGGSSTTTSTVTVGTMTNGTVTVNPTSAAKGDKVTLTVAPAEGYELSTLTVKDASGNTVSTTKVSDTEYSFVMPEGNVTVSATFVEKNATPFTDVKTGDWFYNAVKYVYENDLMAGTSTTTFEPNAKLNRAQAVQILYNLEGQPTVTGTADFTDVSGHWALNAITWAAENGVVAGVGDNKFDPNTNVTREQFAQMMYNYAKFKGYDLSAAGDLSSFSDSANVSDWAETALAWANGEGLINGNEDGTLAPNGTAIRGQAASILMNFDQNVAK